MSLRQLGQQVTLQFESRREHANRAVSHMTSDSRYNTLLQYTTTAASDGRFDFQNGLA